MGRTKKPKYFFAVLNTPYLSKEDLWQYRPKSVVVVLTDYDVSQIQKYMELTNTGAGNKENKNSAGYSISVKYPVEVELITYQDPEETMFDEECAFDPSSSGIYICSEYMYFKTVDANDGWDVAEAEFALSDLRPMKEWCLEEELEFHNLKD